MFKKYLAFFLLLFSTTAYANVDGSRTFNLINNCNKSVWFGFAGGSVQALNNPCATDKDCPTNSTCVQTGDIRQCFWNNPKPANGVYQLKANGGTNSVVIPADPNQNHVWSGALSARMLCANKPCKIADCGDDGKGGCLPGQGFNQPATQAEFTLSRTNIDFYDVEIINGVSVGISMAPVAKPSTTDPYFCGTPGAFKASHGLLGGCSWRFQSPSPDYRWVRGGGKTCYSDSDCNALVSDICGHSVNPGQDPLVQKTCGELLGWWSANQLCGMQNFKCPFNCKDPIDTTHTLWNLYACADVESCYQDKTSTQCCGCVNWDKTGVKVPPAPYTKQCVASNPIWEKEIFPKLKWMKAGCPTAYTYPYDDMSSTFVCSDIKNNINTVDYKITFCPK